MTDHNMGTIDNLLDIQGVATTLSKRERVVLYLWSTGMTQREIGDNIGVNQQRVSVIFRNCIVKLQHNCVLY